MAMITEIFIILYWRVYLIVIGVLILNAMSQLVFAPTLEKAKDTCMSIVFSFVWPLALFSKDGRLILLNKTKQL